MKDSDNLDFEGMLFRVINVHARSILKEFQHQLQTGPNRNVFSPEGKVVLDSRGALHLYCWNSADILIGHHVQLRVHLCADEVVVISIDTRTGRMNLHDTGDLAAAGRGPRFTVITNQLNEDPSALLRKLLGLRIQVRYLDYRIR